MSEQVISSTGTRPGGSSRAGRWFSNPWRKPQFLAALTWGYLAWSILPVLIAVVFSFNSGRSRSTWQGFSLRWWWQDPTRCRDLKPPPRLDAQA